VCYRLIQCLIHNGVGAFLPTQTKNSKPVWPGPACYNAWEQCLLKPVNGHSPISLGFTLDDQTLFFKLQMELGKQIICSFGAITFIV